MNNSKRLGRGLDALFASEQTQSLSADGTEVRMLRLDQIIPSPLQPRRRFDETALATLGESIRKHGILEPIIVRPRDGRFEIVAGERRFQAAVQVGLEQIPVTVRELDDRTTMEIALSENLEREDLSPIEVATSFSDYLAKFGTTQEELAQRLGKDRSTVANLIRLLDLPETARVALDNGAISSGHARALLSLKDERQLSSALAQVVSKQLSVRQTEALVRRLLMKKLRAEVVHDEALRNIQETMQKLLATRVSIRGRVNRGVIEISYFNQEDLLRILGILNSQEKAGGEDGSHRWSVRCILVLLPVDAVQHASGETASALAVLSLCKLKAISLQISDELVNHSSCLFRRHAWEVEHGAARDLCIERPVASEASMRHKHEVPLQK
ncbi:MAG: ParB/RepB/Spo0J family partition protein [Caldiserica bacterium]|nr:ParB/RepB/Spo0J family partition protein [Caldisericota bacterium]